MNIGHNIFGDPAIGHERHRALANQRRIDALPDIVDAAGGLDPRREGPRRTDLVAVTDDTRLWEVEPRYGKLQPDLARPWSGAGHASSQPTFSLPGPIRAPRASTGQVHP